MAISPLNSPALFPTTLLPRGHDPHSLPQARPLRQTTRTTPALPPGNQTFVPALCPTLPKDPPRPLNCFTLSNPLRSFLFILHPGAPTPPTYTFASNQPCLFLLVHLFLYSFSPCNTGRTIASTSTCRAAALAVLVREPFFHAAHVC